MSGPFWVIVPAAGTGSRLKADKPKQYLPLAGASVLFHSLALFCKDTRFSSVVVALSPDDHFFAKSDAASLPVHIAQGGATRHASVLSSLRFIADNAKADDFVWVHDAARPLLTRQDLQQLSTALTENSHGAILATPVADTLKKVSASGAVQQTIDRQNVWRALTPQVFRFKLLLDALEKAEQDGFVVTDEASAVERMGISFHVVSGRDDNLKITQGQDLIIAEQLFAWQKQQGLR